MIEVITFPILDEDFSTLRQIVANPPASEPAGTGFPDLPGDDAPLNGGSPFWTEIPPIGTTLDYTHFEVDHARLVGGDHDWSGGDASAWSIRDGIFANQGGPPEDLDADSIISAVVLTITYALGTAAEDMVDVGSLPIFLHPADEHWFGWENSRDETGDFYDDNWIIANTDYPFEGDIVPSDDVELIGAQTTVDIDFLASAEPIRDLILDNNLCLSTFSPQGLQAGDAITTNSLLLINVYSAFLTITFEPPPHLDGELLPGRRIIP